MLTQAVSVVQADMSMRALAVLIVWSLCSLCEGERTMQKGVTEF